MAATCTTHPVAGWVIRKSSAWGLDSRRVLLPVTFTFLFPSVVGVLTEHLLPGIMMLDDACGKEDLGRQNTVLSDLAKLADVAKI